MVGDGAEAVAAFRDGLFDIVLMDVQMPARDGLTATGEMRALDRAQARSPTPFIALTVTPWQRKLSAAGGPAWMRTSPSQLTGRSSSPPSITCASARSGCPDRGRACGVPDAVAPILDESSLDILASLLGRERIGELLLSFHQEAKRRVAQVELQSANLKQVIDHAHALVSLAGQLGSRSSPCSVSTSKTRR